MKKIKLAGRKVSAIGIGTWHMGDNPAEEQSEIAAIRAGIDAGADVIDTAEMYGNGKSESLLKKALLTYDRDKLFLISKVLPNNASVERMEHSLDASLDRLGTAYLDLYLYHWRGKFPLSETVNELQRLVEKGKIRSWGVSNFDTSDMKELWSLPNGNMVAANEDLYNLGNRGIDYDLVKWQQAHEIPLIAYSPLGGYRTSDSQMIKDTKVRKIAEKYQVSVQQVLLAWTIRNKTTIAIPQTSNPAHMKANIEAGNLELTEEDLQLLEQAFPEPKVKEPLAIR
ncbi:aldo/keto reductase [Liquorilactobacillus oeni]|uniref:Aldo keto reductase family oxidoreductase n=1 Tax=Liquorilactobacillus oeni DSM 19972 TaxID=1423777 RepID=A0A0R1MJG1_9LACO|nr:aldo/keto reductase [Liquorilactobacillus oeni]KRL04619.1 aldo keto reductase family oxidoreductase [Liquorilactobacillus oeni DSM 19972]